MIKTLIDEFCYPRLGPGQMWEVTRDRIRGQGGAVHLDRRVVQVEHDGSMVTSFLARDSQGRLTRYHGRALPLDPADSRLDPSDEPGGAAERVMHAAESLNYRDFLTVVLIVDRPHTFPDNWIYIHEPQVKLGRIQNFKNWSPDLVPDPQKTSLGLEYFCFEGDDLWTSSDADLIALGRREVDAIGLVDSPGSHRRLRRPDAQGIPGLRRSIPGQPGGHPRLAGHAAEPRAGRAKWHA